MHDGSMRMIPDQVSPTTKSQAERQLFARLRRIEDTDWYYVLHSLNLSEHAWKRMSEIDFLLVGPRGIYVIEVKGGYVSCRQGIWEFTDRYGHVHRRNESPFSQARSAMFALEARLRKAVPSALLSRVTFGYGVAFPDCDFNVHSVEWAPETVLDRRQLDRPDGVRRSLGRLAAYWRAKPGGRDALLDAAEAETLLVALRPDFDTVPTLRQIASAVESELVGLTATQYRALDASARNERLIFEGGAGTGKTMLAAEMCRRHAADGRSVLFTCRSETLAGFVRAQPGMADVTVLAFGHLTARTSERWRVC